MVLERSNTIRENKKILEYSNIMCKINKITLIFYYVEYCIDLQFALK